MTDFEENIIGIYGEQGRIWLSHLPKKVEKFAIKWGLKGLEAYNNLSHHYVLKGYQEEKPIVLKLGPDRKLLSCETSSLKALNGYGAVSVINYEEDAILLQRAVPGNTLKSSFSSSMAIKIACDVTKKLHQAPAINLQAFPFIADWLQALDKNWNIPSHHLRTARLQKNQLLKTNNDNLILLHGDLHQDNILSNGDDWLVIDAKGVIGQPINELWALIEEPKHDLPFVANYFQLELSHLVKWYYVHLVLAACWRVEDNLDAQLFLDLADLTETTYSREISY